MLGRRISWSSAIVALAGLVAACGSGAATATLGPPIPTPTTIPTPTPEPTPSATPEPSPTPEPTCLETAPLRILVGQLVMALATPAQLRDVVDLADAGVVGGVALLGEPSLAEVSALRDAVTTPFIIASDEEGGRVQRLAEALGPLPSAAALAQRSPAVVTETIAAYGTALREAGVSLVLAPVVDVGGGPGIGDRAFSSDPAVVAEYAAAVVAGYTEAGVLPVLKHFPGHGRASADSHLGVSMAPAIDRLRRVDLVPYESLLSPNMGVLVGHLLVPGLTEDLPTSLSPETIDGLLRGELGFDGLVLTDALGMGAISQRWNNADAAVLAIVAGADVVIIDKPAGAATVVDALVAARRAGTLTRHRIETSVARYFEATGRNPCELRR